LLSPTLGAEIWRQIYLEWKAGIERNIKKRKEKNIFGVRL
jgi:hypothetical protein